MASGTVWVEPWKDPANMSVAPNSPSARPHASAVPAASPARALGMTTRTNVAASLKEMHFKGYAASRMRMADGKAFRRPQ